MNQNIGTAGEYPFTRGVYPDMYKGRLWTMRQYAGFATAKETNERYRYLLNQGTQGLSVAFDLPTQMGFDSDDKMARGEVGRVGVAIDTIDDMAVLFHDIPLDKVSISMTINATAPILLAMLFVLAERNGISPDKLRGTIQNDILKEYIARGTYIYPPNESMRLTTDVFKYCSTNIPNWNTISISGYHMREAGCTAVQELAFTLSNAIAYVQAAIDIGLDVDQFAGRLSFFFNSHNNFLEEISKFRAARRMWAKIMKDRFNARSQKSMMLRFHTQTAGSTLTATQIENNVARVTLQALAAVLGGTQSLHTNGMDEALSLPTQKAARVALRTQQVIAHESKVVDHIDPFGGSYVVESLTNELEEGANQYISKIDKMGGAIAAITNRYIQGEIENSAYTAQCALEENSEIQVGTNAFCIDETDVYPSFKIDSCIENDQILRLSTFKQLRNNNHVTDSLRRLKASCQTEGDEIFPVIIDCVRKGSTLGEISWTMRDVFGVYRY